MGLDMYLSRRLYVKHWDHHKDNYVVTVKKGGKAVKGINPKKISHITEEAMYWRKANHIHKWFVDKVQNYVDDCGEHDVSSEQLKELRDLCKQVIDIAQLVPGQLHASTSYTDGAKTENYVEGKIIANAEDVADLLPTTSGCFFGSTDYNEWYLEDVKNTYEVLCELDLEDYDWSYYYQSSW